MSVDTISNMLSALKNASAVGKEYLELPYSRQSEEVAKILKKEGYLSGVKVFKHKDKVYKGLRLDLVYIGGQPSFNTIKRISTPGRRMYRGNSKLESLRAGFGTLVVSTSRGVMTAKEAKAKKLGGEVICVVK